MLLLSLIFANSPPRLPSGAGDERPARMTTAEQLELASRLLDARRELLAIALLDPASLDAIERIAADLETGARRADTIVAEPITTPDVARALFDGFHVRAARLHAEAPSAPALVAPELALRTSQAVADSLALQWDAVERILQSSWVRGAGEAWREEPEGLPSALAERVRVLRSEVDAIKHRFVTSHQGLVRNVVQRYRGFGLSREDLMQDGSIGLIRAVEKFDVRRGKPFPAYAVWWVRQAVRNALAMQARMIRLPVSALARQSAIARASSRLSQELGRAPSQHELEIATGFSSEAIADVHRMSRAPLSLDAPRSSESERTLADSLADTSALSPNEQASARERADRLGGLLERLTPRERFVLRRRFGLDGDGEHTLEEIGDELGLTRERIRQIVAGALETLNRTSREHDFAPPGVRPPGALSARRARAEAV